MKAENIHFIVTNFDYCFAGHTFTFQRNKQNQKPYFKKRLFQFHCLTPERGGAQHAMKSVIRRQTVITISLI